MKPAVIVIAGALLVTPACAQKFAQPTNPFAEELAAIIRNNQQIVTHTPGAEGLFSVGDDGAVKHLRSGLVCPALFPNVRLFQLLVSQSAKDDGDIGCDYRRLDEHGGTFAQLTISASKASPGMTLDAAFTRYQREVVQAWKTARSLGPVKTIQVDEGKAPDIRSEEYHVTVNERDSTSDLVVTLSAGWIIKVRATYPGSPIEIRLDQDLKEALLATGDRVMTGLAFEAAITTVGK